MDHPSPGQVRRGARRQDLFRVLVSWTCRTGGSVGNRDDLFLIRHLRHLVALEDFSGEVQVIDGTFG